MCVVNYFLVSSCSRLLSFCFLSGRSLVALGQYGLSADHAGVAVVSHGWLQPGHPDPQGARKQDVLAIQEHSSFFAYGVLQHLREDGPRARFDRSPLILHMAGASTSERVEAAKKYLC